MRIKLMYLAKIVFVLRIVCVGCTAFLELHSILE
jgi:hypothetical protein